MEIGFLNNPTDAAFISDPNNQEKLANEILDGIVKAAGSIKNQSTTKVSTNSKVLQAYLPDSVKPKLKKGFL